MKEVKVGMGREGRLYSDDLVLCGVSQRKDLKVLEGCFVEVFRIRGLKVNADRAKQWCSVECDIRVNGALLEKVSESKYLGLCFAECRRKVASGWKVAGAIRSLISARGLQLECVRMLHEGLLVPVLLYGSETVIWGEKDRCRIRAVQMDNHRGLLGIRRMDRVPTG